jgi:hypothetical protein
MLRVNARGAVLTSVIALILVLLSVAQWKRNEIDAWRGSSTPDIANQDSKLEDIAEFKDDAATPVIPDYSAANSTLGVSTLPSFATLEKSIRLIRSTTIVPSNPRTIPRNKMASRRPPRRSKSLRHHRHNPPTAKMERPLHQSLPRLRSHRSPRRSNGMARPPRPPQIRNPE